MKITRRHLRRIIREELNESWTSDTDSYSTMDTPRYLEGSFGRLATDSVLDAIKAIRNGQAVSLSVPERLVKLLIRLGIPIVEEAPGTMSESRLLKESAVLGMLLANPVALAAIAAIGVGGITALLLAVKATGNRLSVKTVPPSLEIDPKVE